jgi:inosose dehydratase
MTLSDKYLTLQCQVGANPIVWTNDDFKDLGGSTPLETCLDEMREAGYSGSELGHKYPKEAAALQTVLKRNGLKLVSGWHSTFLATAPIEEQIADFRRHLSLLKSCDAKVAIVAECSRCVHGSPESPLEFVNGEPALTKSEWKLVYSGLELLGAICRAEGMELVYHHHMGTVVQREAELDALLAGAPSLRLLYDTGHLSFAGIEPMRILEKYGSRISHVHLKNVRAEVADEARKQHWSFAQSVRSGVFTVPGDPDGCVDFIAVFEGLAALNYRGWLVVEAEQDPVKANPLRYATLAREYIRDKTGL